MAEPPHRRLLPPLLPLLLLLLLPPPPPPGSGSTTSAAAELLRSPASAAAASSSGVESLLEEFHRQLQQEEQEQEPAGSRGHELLAEAAAVGGRCRGGGGSGAGSRGSFFSARPDAIIRTKDSVAAGATFLGSPGSVAGLRHCLDACCADPRCTLAVLQQLPPPPLFRCYLFNCTYRGRAVCLFSPQRGYSSYCLEPSSGIPPGLETDDPPLSKAGQDIVLQLPANWVILDGRESLDDHGITQYEWTLLQGAPSVDMKEPQPGTLKLSHLQEGTYILQLTVTDTAGQRSSDNVSVTVLPMAHSVLGCVGIPPRSQFICGDGYCIDITYTCDGEEQCRDGSDEAFCQTLNSRQKTVSHTAISSIQQNILGLTKGARKEPSFDVTQKTVVSNRAPDADKSNQSSSSQGPKQQIAELMPEQCLMHPTGGPCNGRYPRWHFDAFSGTCLRFIYGGCEGNENNFLEESDCLAACRNGHDSRTSGKDSDDHNGSDTVVLRGTQTEKSHPVPEAGAVLPLALGLAITALLLLMVTCRLRLLKQKLKKARPIMSEESDYLINGMYL